MLFSFSLSDHPSDSQACLEVIADLDQKLGDQQPAALIALVSAEYEPGPVLARLAERWPGASLAGMTTDGCASSIDGFCEDSIAVLSVSGDGVSAQVAFAEALSEDPEGKARRAASELRTEHGSTSCLVFFSHGVNGCEVVDGVAAALEGTVLVGAVSSDHGSYATCSEFAGTRALSDSLVIVGLKGPEPVTTGSGVGSGWAPVGEPQPITRGHSNIVDEIGGLPALDFYRDHLGDALGESLEPFPLWVEVDGALPVLRAVLQEPRTDGSLRFGGTVPLGASVRMTSVEPTGLLSGTRASVTAALEALEEGTAPALILLTSCAGRKWLMGPSIEDEVKVAAEAARDFGYEDVPVLAFYAFGEVEPGSRSMPTAFHNNTCVSLALGAA